MVSIRDTPPTRGNQGLYLDPVNMTAPLGFWRRDLGEGAGFSPLGGLFQWLLGAYLFSPDLSGAPLPRHVPVRLGPGSSLSFPPMAPGKAEAPDFRSVPLGVADLSETCLMRAARDATFGFHGEVRVQVLRAGRGRRGGGGSAR